MKKKPGNPARGSTTGRPVMVLLDLLGQRWALRVLWELRDERLTFRELQARCDDVSPSSLNKRLRELRDVGLVDRITGDEATGFGLSPVGKELGTELLRLSRFAERWADQIDRDD